MIFYHRHGTNEEGKRRKKKKTIPTDERTNKKDDQYRCKTRSRTHNNHSRRKELLEIPKRWYLLSAFRDRSGPNDRKTCTAVASGTQKPKTTKVLNQIAGVAADLIVEERKKEGQKRERERERERERPTEEGNPLHKVFNTRRPASDDDAASAFETPETRRVCNRRSKVKVSSVNTRLRLRRSISIWRSESLCSLDSCFGASDRSLH
jgi:hypothetical protein